MNSIRIFFEDNSGEISETQCNLSFVNSSKRVRSSHLYKSLETIQLEMLLLLVDSRVGLLVRDHKNLFSGSLEVIGLCEKAVDALKNPTSASELGKLVLKINDAALKKGYTLTILRR